MERIERMIREFDGPEHITDGPNLVRTLRNLKSFEGTVLQKKDIELAERTAGHLEGQASVRPLDFVEKGRRAIEELGWKDRNSGSKHEDRLAGIAHIALGSAFATHVRKVLDAQYKKRQKQQ